VVSVSDCSSLFVWANTESNAILQPKKSKSRELFVNMAVGFKVYADLLVFFF